MLFRDAEIAEDPCSERPTTGSKLARKRARYARDLVSVDEQPHSGSSKSVLEVEPVELRVVTPLLDVVAEESEHR
jgi:hypothetical protein